MFNNPVKEGPHIDIVCIFYPRKKKYVKRMLSSVSFVSKLQLLATLSPQSGECSILHSPD